MKALYNFFPAFLLLLVGLFVTNDVQARHIIGGDVTYECLSIDTINMRSTYLITFTMYRDQFGNGAPFDSPAQFGVFIGSGNNFSQFDVETHFPNTPTVIPIEDSPCVEIPDNIGVERGVYQFEITLPISDQSYVISYLRCCRNNTINNIIDAQDTGAAFTVEISPTSQTTCNNSPVFNGFPPIVICAGQPLVFDHSATDAEGDQLVYEFCPPKIGGGPFGTNENPGDPEACNGVIPNHNFNSCPPPYDDVLFALPTYSFSNPMGGNPQVSINTNTGLITGTPEITGQFVVGVCVKEFRDGVLIGQINRDFQFNVVQCEIKVFADVENDEIVGDQEFVINSCGENTIDFINASTDPNFIETYDWTFDINGDIQTFNTRDVQVTFPGVGLYTGTMILNLGNEECSDTANISVNVYPSIDADFEFEYDTCVAGPVSFTDLSTTGSGLLTGWDWDFGPGEDGSTTNNPFHLFNSPGDKNVQLTVRDINECEDSITQVVNWFPIPPIIVIEPSNFIGCSPAEIFFNNLSSPIDSTYTINWEFSDGQTSNEISPTMVFEEEGIYSVYVEIISPIGCETEAEFPNWIRVEPKPTADFTFSPEVVSSLNRNVSFFDQSEDAISWFWNFNNEGTAFEPNPTYTFRDTGIHEIQLIVLHPSGCPDTLTKIIDVIPEVRYFLPNAFTPNNDSTNDSFKAAGLFDGITDFNMTIWNRWGEKIFESDDPSEGWNGQVDNVGAMSPNGVYVYVVRYKGPRGEIEELKGFATLIR